MPSPHTARSRRAFLRASAGAVALGALAGCSSSCPDSDPPTPATVVRLDGDPSGEALPVGGPDWPTLRGDATNRGLRPANDPPGEGATLRWRTDVAASPAWPSAPAIADNGSVVYVVGGDGTLHALAAADGSERWRAPAVRNADAVTASNGTVYVASDDGVVAVRTDSGEARWERPDLTATGTPVAHDGDVYVPTDGALYAFDAVSGDRRWRVPTDGPVTRPAVGLGAVFVAGGALQAVDPADGSVRWTDQVGGVEDFPVVADGTVYVGSYDGLLAYDRDGTRRWRFERGGGRAFEAPVVAGRTLYTVEQPGEGPASLFALERDDAGGEPTPRWSPYWCSYTGDATAWAAVGDAAFATIDSGTGPAGGEGLQSFRERDGWAGVQFRTDRSLRAPALTDEAAVLVTSDGAVCGVGGR
ncbi:MAG: PQQ-binding-like beta-propeller repeat protein [Halobacteriaceae archaeon]